MECYICYEQTEEVILRDICACRNVGIHKSCFADLLDKVCKNGHCSVCRTPFLNIDIQTLTKANARYVHTYIRVFTLYAMFVLHTLTSFLMCFAVVDELVLVTILVNTTKLYPPAEYLFEQTSGVVVRFMYVCIGSCVALVNFTITMHILFELRGGIRRLRTMSPRCVFHNIIIRESFVAV
jgi:hypothetical protein